MGKFVIFSLLCSVAIIVIVIGYILKLIVDIQGRIDKRKDEIIQLQDELIRKINGLEEQIKSWPQQNVEFKKDGEPKKAEPAVEISKECHETQPIKRRQDDIEHILYASSYDGENKKFFSVESTPSQKTVYEITYSDSIPEVGYFTIYSGAENMVVECRDHLDTASEIEGRGKGIDWSSITSGRLQRRDNNWEVIQPLTVKFV